MGGEIFTNTRREDSDGEICFLIKKFFIKSVYRFERYNGRDEDLTPLTTETKTIPNIREECTRFDAAIVHVQFFLHNHF